MFANIPYNAKEDLVGISTIASSPIMFAVNPSLPIQSFAALVDYARKNPGQVNFATAGAGGSSRMMVELFKQTTGTDVGYISYKGASQALTDLVAGRVGAMAIDFSALYPMVEQGRLRALAITSDHRNKHLPDVPTVAEAGYPSLQAGNWYAVMAPANTPDAIISKLNAALRKVSGSADMIKALDPMGMEGMTQSSSTTFSRFLTDEFDRWGEVVTKAGITAE
jgi:tripartite-type tricarboxylate transporter receptor subunit TctC